MAARRPLVNVAGSFCELPVGDTVQGVSQWLFGTGTPNDGAGAPGDYYVASDNKLWQKGATTWTYTGVQYGALGAVPAKTTPVDADVLSLGDSANGYQMAKLTLANLRTFLGGGIGYRSVTAAATLAASDAAKIIDCSGSWTLGFAAAATLGAGWWCYLRNAGAGDVTLDPNGSEQIDGLTSYPMYPGEVRLVQCDGTAFRSVVVAPFCKTFSASGTFIKPPGYVEFGVRVKAGDGGGGGGGSGGAISGNFYPSGSASGGAGGAGGSAGADLTGNKQASDVSASSTVTVGAKGAGGNGGAGVTSTSGSAAGNPGANGGAGGQSSAFGITCSGGPGGMLGGGGNVNTVRACYELPAEANI